MQWHNSKITGFIKKKKKAAKDFSRKTLLKKTRAENDK